MSIKTTKVQIKDRVSKLVLFEYAVPDGSGGHVRCALEKAEASAAHMSGTDLRWVDLSGTDGDRPPPLSGCHKVMVQRT